MKLARGIATPIIPLSAAGTGGWDAIDTLGDEWRGFSLDFTSNTYAMRLAAAGELLLGSGPNRADAGLGLDLLADSYAIGI